MILANRPEKEGEGQSEIQNIFIERNHWPEIVIHRGHSYYAWATIESLNPEARIVVLGSCGGYNNISKVLDISPESQIISSKQIGTMLVNNEVIYQMNETIRLGKDIDWAILWKSIETKFKGNREAIEKFNDYIPPHQNLGALFIKTYRERI
jgi:NADPH-dependent curcumin reductase CurA